MVIAHAGETLHPPPPCEGEVMPVLQMRKLRSQLSQDILTWRQGGHGPYRADCLRPAWRTCSTPPPLLPWDSMEWHRPRSEGAAGFYSRVRLALLQGLSQLPGASRADCLPPPEEGSLLSGLISCQLSVFFVFAAASGKQMGWGGQRMGLPEQGLPCFCSQALS